MCDPTWQPKKAEVTKSVNANSLHTSTCSYLTNEVLLQTFRTWVVGSQRCAYIRAIADGGSQTTFIREDISKTLCLKELGSTSLQLNTFGQAAATSQRRRLVEVRLRSQYDGTEHLIQAVEVPFICQDVVQVPAEHDFVKTLEDSGHNIADKLYIPGMAAVPGIGLLVGCDHLWQLMTGEIKRYSGNAGMVALDSVFGWMFQGPLSLSTSVNLTMNTCVLRVSASAEPADSIMQKFWELESIGIVDQDNTMNEASDVLCEFKRNVKFKEGRYEVALPWKDNGGRLDDNKTQAMKRLLALGMKLRRHPEFGQQYDSTIRSYMTLGHAERVKEIGPSSFPVYYMPHHAVIRSESTTTKVRVVFDASSHGPEYTSLNEHLEKGPRLLADLTTLLIKFRLHPIALTADIEKAFLQICIREQDRDALRFLWFKQVPSDENPKPEVEEWRMTRVPFGTTASPFLLNATLQHHLRLVSGSFRDTAALLAKSFYVDDLLVGADTDQEAQRVFTEANAILESAGMRLRKWTSNSTHLQQLFEQEEGITSTDGTLKILGMVWEPRRDLMTIASKSVLSFFDKDRNSKRSVLHTVARIFDPLGMIAPFTVQAKILFQELWKRDVSWD